MNRKTFRAISCEFEQQPDLKKLFKSKFSHELGEMKENNFTIVQTMTAYFWSWLWTINNKIFFQLNTTGVLLRKIHIVRHVQHFCWFWEYFQWNKYHCFGFISFLWTELPKISKLLVSWTLTTRYNNATVCKFWTFLYRLCRCVLRQRYRFLAVLVWNRVCYTESCTSVTHQWWRPNCQLL